MDNQSKSLSRLDQLVLFQSANCDDISIRRNFVVRTAEFERIVDRLKNNSATDPLQHELITLPEYHSSSSPHEYTRSLYSTLHDLIKKSGKYYCSTTWIEL
jgi:hypothetical protein